MKISTLSTYIFFAFITIINAQKIRKNLPLSDVDFPTQRHCAMHEADSLLRKKHPKLSAQDFENKMKKLVSDYNKKNWAARTEADTIFIPVIVHIISSNEAIGTGANITTSQVYSQLDALNEDYQRILGTNGYNTSPLSSPILIKFVPASHSPSGAALSEPGIDRINITTVTSWTLVQLENSLKPNTQWDPTKYMNIWTVRFGGTLTKTLGYAQLPSLSGLDGLDPDEGEANTDGVVIRYNAFGRTGSVKAPYNLGRTTTHEVGHFLGLRHIWGDADNCTGTDYCADTPPTTEAIYNCPSAASSCTEGLSAMIQNYMDYTDDACMNIFTNDQKTRIMTVLTNSPRRKELRTSSGYIPSQKPLAQFVASNTTICKSTSVTFTDQSGRVPTSWSWKVLNSNNQTIAMATTASFNLNFTATGMYSVQLIATNTFGSDTALKKNYIQVVESGNTSYPIAEDFESGAYLSNWLFSNPSGNDNWQISNTASANGVGSKSLFFNNFDSTYNQTGIKTAFISPKFNFSSNQFAYLTFDVAYARFSNYSDTLSVSISTDCGASYSTLWKRGGLSLATAPDANDLFTPTSNQWRTEQLSLGALNGFSNVQFKIENISGWGNALYIDNIKIFTPARTSVPGSNFIANPTTVCGGNVVTLIDQSTQFPTAWAWTITHKTNATTPISSTTQNPSVLFNVSGIYHIQLIASNSVGQGSTNLKSNYLMIKSNPTISIFASATEVECGKPVTLSAYGGNQYTWYSDRSDQPINLTNSYIVTDTVFYSTTYYVLASNTEGCESIESVNIDTFGECAQTGIEDENSLKNLIQVFPNPTVGVLNIIIPNKTANVDFELINMHGVSVFKQTITESTSTYQLPILPNGMYYYKLGSMVGKLTLSK
jgi:PKD repeat protein